MSSSKLQLPADDSVLLLVSHSNLTTFSSDIRVSQQTTVEALKEKLWRKTGTAVASMRLELRDDTGAKIADLDHDAAPLASYSPYNGYRLHIIDLDPSSVTSGGWLEDTSLVDKYTISDEAYNKLDTNFRKFKEKMVSKNPTSDDKEQSDKHTEELCANIKVGDRCEVEPGAKRGTVKFVGRAEALGRGFWVGVQYDEPLGKHDGMVKGIRFFECPQVHGAIVRPGKVKFACNVRACNSGYGDGLLHCSILGLQWQTCSVVAFELAYWMLATSQRETHLKKRRYRQRRGAFVAFANVPCTFVWEAFPC